MRRVNSFQISAADRLTLLSSGFMPALMNIFSALLSGACVCPFPAKQASSRALVRWLQDEEITIYHSSASLFREVLDALTGDEDLSKIRLIRSASEAVTTREIHACRKHFSSDCIYVTGLSTTETSTTTFNFIDKATRIDTDRVPIGYPLQDIEVLLLDEGRQPVQPGSIGEIAIRSEYISPGYWRNEDLTAAKFLPDPEGGDKRIFLTGDSGRQLDDGRIEHLGRKDFRSKIRGYSVEPGDVEAKLLTHPHIKEVAVIGTQAASGESGLIGYFVPTRRPGPTVRELREFLGKTLPDFMIPSAFVTLEVLPRTLNGKIDRRALPDPASSQPARASAFVPPRTRVEREVARMWGEVLRLDAISLDDDFYDLGGHSLAATRIANRIAETFGLELPLRSLFQCPTIAEMAALIALHASIEQPPHEQKQLVEPSAPSGSRDRSAPLSHPQLRLWFLDQLHPGRSTYNLFLAYRIEGDLDLRRLEQALNEVIRRHEILRTVFKTADGEPFQMVLPHSTLPIPLHDLRATPGVEERWTEARRICEREAREPFDIRAGPLLRITLIRLGNHEYVLTRAMHHIVGDGWSDGILFGELWEIYEAVATGRPIALPDLPTQYAEFSRRQRQASEDANLQHQLSYWRRQLDNAAPLNLPTDRPRHASQSRRGARRYFALSKSLSSALKNLSRECGATLFTTLLAAYQTLLQRYSNQTDIVIGCPVARRNRTELEGLIGFFLNMLVMRLDLSGNPTFTEALGRARDVCLGALEHQEVRFEKIVEELHPDRRPDHNPFFEVTFAFRNTPCVVPELTGLKVEALHVQTGIARFDLHLFLEEVAGHLEGYFDYDTNLFHAETIERTVGHFENLLKAVVEDPHRRISDLPLLSEAEQQQLLIEWNDTARDYPGDKCAHELFEARVAERPNAVALVFGNREVTYGELNTRANQLAHYLRRLDVRRDSLVAVCMDRSVEMVVALLGILKAGGAYVPLDPAYPQQRLAFMLQDAQIGLILTDSASIARLPPTGARRLSLDHEWEHISTGPAHDLPNENTSDDLAYVIYTSGSTGTPKGVEVRHRGIVRLLFGVDYVQLDSARTLIHMAPISFDAATFELWGALLHGARCVLFPGLVPSARELGALLQRHSIDTLWLTTALFNAVVDDEPQALSGIKQLLFGGEAGSLRHVKKALALLPHTKITNFYGPTENTTFTSCYPIPRRLDDTLTSVPIGRPIANTRIYLLDPHLKPVPVGVPGELYIGGDGLARGYLNRDDVTAERFVADPFAAAGSKLYKSGDLARYLPDANIEFLGRLDDQVKIRGFRIEPGEVEAALKHCSGVRECAVIACADDTGDKTLMAYVVASPGDSLDAQRIRTELRSTLPD
ncbi:MAG TPA: amino acid adenylation domain-containing protein, partial [Gemmatimonadaceae bacterium]|nr:amino acid adenylation domain-containing protein [Gemmatimonadaceae bacterium]